MQGKVPQGCQHCHGAPNEVDSPSRIGLKGAYHRQCIGCHERQPATASAPTACDACHHPWTPDHGSLVDLTGKPRPQDVTGMCLSCHPRVGRDIMATAHWRWQGYSPAIKGYEHRADVSLTHDGQQHLHLDRLEHAGVRVVPHRVRLGGREVRLLQPEQHRLPGLPRHDGRLSQGAEDRRHARPVARPGRDREEGRPALAAGVRIVPFRERRRPVHQARRPRAGAGRAAGRSRHAHGPAQHAVPGLPPDRRAPHRGHVDERAVGRRPGALRELPRPDAARRGGHPEPAPRRPRPGGGVRDVPHPVDCARPADAAPARLLGRRRRSRGRGSIPTACPSTTSASAR